VQRRTDGTGPTGWVIAETTSVAVSGG
jgi:hypothetical protein